MDLGSEVCTPKAPTCGTCPLSSVCVAVATGRTNTLPVRGADGAKGPRPVGVVTAIFVAGRTMLVRRRPVGGLWSGLWEFPFPEEETRDGPFERLDGSIVQVPMMSQRQEFGYVNGDGYQAVELPYDGRELSMVILLPDVERFGEIEAALGPAQLSEILKGLHVSDIKFTMPRFRYETKLPLKGTLMAMGMSDAFGEVADFSGMDGTRNLFITDVVHQAFVSVNEAGTEAAAATAVVVGVTSVPMPVTIDRPFIFVIRDIPTKALLFVGRVLDPM